MSVAFRLEHPINPAPADLITPAAGSVQHIEPVERKQVASEAPDAGYRHAAEAPDAGYARDEPISAIFHGRSQS